MEPGVASADPLCDLGCEAASADSPLTARSTCQKQLEEKMQLPLPLQPASQKRELRAVQQMQNPLLSSQLAKVVLCHPLCAHCWEWS